MSDLRYQFSEPFNAAIVMHEREMRIVENGRNTMTNDEKEKLNRALHLARGESCWHESDDTERATVRCKHCGNGFGGGAWERVNPDYAGNLIDCFELQSWVIEKVGHEDFVYALICITDPDDLADDDGVHLYQAATATAEQRALAMARCLGVGGDATARS